jgi:hypothetical protein
VPVRILSDRGFASSDRRAAADTTDNSDEQNDQQHEEEEFRDHYSASDCKDEQYKERNPQQHFYLLLRWKRSSWYPTFSIPNGRAVAARYQRAFLLIYNGARAPSQTGRSAERCFGSEAPGYNQAMTRVLVVVTSQIDADQVGSLIGERFGDDVELRVMAPASGISRLDWLTNAEDDARDDAVDRAEKTAEAIPGEGIDATLGDTDPVQAIEDELREFPADQIVVITKTDDEATWLETGSADSARQRFDVPVTHLVSR